MYKFLTCVLLITVTSAATAQKLPMTIGGSSVFHVDYAKFNVTDYSRSNQGELRKLVFSQTIVTGGEYLSFEAFMCELGVGLWSGRSTVRTDMYNNSFRHDEGSLMENPPGLNVISGLGRYDIMGMDLNLFLGKYPFRLGERVSFFPQIGICYQITLSMKNEAAAYGIKVGDFNALSFKPGGGFDFAITDKLLLRAEALFALRLDTNYERQLKKQFNSDKASVGYGPEIKFGVRYKFNKQRKTIQ